MGRGEVCAHLWSLQNPSHQRHFCSYQRQTLAGAGQLQALWEEAGHTSTRGVSEQKRLVWL